MSHQAQIFALEATMAPDETGETLGNIARRVGLVEDELREFRKDLAQAQYQILGRIDGLDFVRRDLYDSERRGFLRDMEALKETNASTRAIAMYALGVLVSAVIGAIIVAILAATR